MEKQKNWKTTVRNRKTMEYEDIEASFKVY